MKNILLAFATFFSAITIVWAEDALTVTNALVREAPPGMMMTAGYADWRNTSGEAIIINGVSSDAFNMIEIHLSSIENGIARMTPQDSLTVPANGSIKLEPGGLHLMLMGAKEAVKAGDTIDITLHTSIGNKTVTFTVKRF